MTHYLMKIFWPCSNTSTEDMIHIYGNLLQNANEQTSVRSVAQKLLMKMIGMVDVSAAAADGLGHPH